MLTAKTKVNKVYKTVALRPKKAAIKVMTAGFKTGEVSKKETAPANGARLFISPTNTGIVEHEQNGVTNPIQAPSTALITLLGRLSQPSIRFCDMKI